MLFRGERLALPWRIRLVAYGARLESVLGESPQGFESPILRHVHESPDQGFQVGAFVMLQAGCADGQARAQEREEGATRR